MRRTRLHVVPDGDGWLVKPEGANGPAARTRTQEDAVRIATDMARTIKPSQVLVHRPDGTFREEHTYGDDPERYPG
jgi:hypothetical protein